MPVIEKEAECCNFLKISYGGNTYNMEDFAAYCSNFSLNINSITEKCEFIYRDVRLTYEQLCQRARDFPHDLPFSCHYSETLHSLSTELFSYNNDYYIASVVVGKLENCLQIGRYYLIKSHSIFQSNAELPWLNGYQAHYAARTFNFATAIMWYNNCFDYILQIPYFFYGLYRLSDSYNKTVKYSALSKGCDYRTLSDIYGNNKTITGFRELWKIITKCSNALRTVNKWANYIKHKGGVQFSHLNPPNLLFTIVKHDDGNVTAMGEDFDVSELDMDASYQELVNAHKSIVLCINHLMEFIDFEHYTNPPRLVISQQGEAAKKVKIISNNIKDML